MLWEFSRLCVLIAKEYVSFILKLAISFFQQPIFFFTKIDLYMCGILWLFVCLILIHCFITVFMRSQGYACVCFECVSVCVWILHFIYCLHLLLVLRVWPIILSLFWTLFSFKISPIQLFQGDFRFTFVLHAPFEHMYRESLIFSFWVTWKITLVCCADVLVHQVVLLEYSKNGKPLVLGIQIKIKLISSSS